MIVEKSILLSFISDPVFFQIAQGTLSYLHEGGDHLRAAASDQDLPVCHMALTQLAVRQMTVITE